MVNLYRFKLSIFNEKVGCEAGTEAAGAIMKEKSALNGFRSADHSDEPLKANSVSGTPSTESESHLHRGPLKKCFVLKISPT